MAYLTSLAVDALVQVLREINQGGRDASDVCRRRQMRVAKCAILSALVHAYPEEVLAIQDDPHRPDLVSVRIRNACRFHVPVWAIDTDAKRAVIGTPV